MQRWIFKNLVFVCVRVLCSTREGVESPGDGVTGNHEPAPIGCSLQLPTQGRCAFKTFKLLLFFTTIKVSIFQERRDGSEGAYWQA